MLAYDQHPGSAHAKMAPGFPGVQPAPSQTEYPDKSWKCTLELEIHLSQNVYNIYIYIYIYMMILSDEGTHECWTPGPKAVRLHLATNVPGWCWYQVTLPTY